MGVALLIYPLSVSLLAKVMTGQVYYECLEIGDVLWSADITAEEDAMVAYAEEVDTLPFHVHPEAAKSSRCGQIVASAGYIIGLWYKMMHDVRSQRPMAFLGTLQWQIRFVSPLYPGDRLRLKHTILGKREASNPDHGLAISMHEIFNQNDECVMWVEVTDLVARH